MDKPRHNDQLAVKKKIKKTPLHLPSLANNGCTSKNRLERSIVPLLTTSSPIPMNMIRPAALSLINRPHDVLAQPTRNAAESPVSVSLLQTSSGDQMQPSHSYRSLSLPSARFSGGGGILPTPASVSIHSPQSSFGDSHDYQQPPRFYGSSASSVPILPSPRFDGPGILPTPPPLQYPSPLQPRSFTSSSMAQGGILGPGKFPPRP